MTFVDTLVRIHYVELGYLPNLPYHMITDEEMVNAFIGPGNYFDSVYYCPGKSVEKEYNNLRTYIANLLAAYLDDNSEVTTIPNWIYGYMLGNVITYTSDAEDIIYLYQLNNLIPKESYDIFSEELAASCLAVSKAWIAKLTSSKLARVPTPFGEPHVIKSLRLSAVNV